MLLVIDVGNTNIVFGVYQKSNLLASWRLQTDKNRTSDEFGITILDLIKYENIDYKNIDAVIISSVVPPIMYSLEHAVRKYFELEPVVVNHGMKTNLNICIDNPKELGSDRIVNSVAAVELYGVPLIIIDFGTATTFCVINSNKEYIGGAICPGIKISTEALYQYAAKLPRIELAKPETVICKNTVTSMQSGIIYGYAGQVDYLVSRMKEELCEEDIKVIATGGLAPLIASESKQIQQTNSLLTLEGLRILYEKNTR